ncbi:hypothetical protein [Dyadobacter sp. LHD-138]|uniref:hypothetical protein n=1 Tax=Dyadobacter sp. LHD-138 TaxID=3071413 RepID=UPI0027E1B073|nr:hypothetical protein [Dyadobacter sp. LHD-138]MDQ6480166.1 hypothetical protein [Dyadobacter sp. LHD-138]
MHKIFKFLAVLFTLFGVAIFFNDQSKGSEIPLLAGLFMIFVSKEKIEDERVKILKSSSAYIALIVGYGFKLISTNLYEHQAFPFQLIDINHFLILVFALAICIYYLRLYLSWE